MLRDRGVQIADAVGQVVEAVAFGRDPGHFGAFLEQTLIIGLLHGTVLAIKRVVQTL